MRNPPTGTVTFLFTDVEGSTQLTRRSPEAMRAALTRHHAILDAAIQAQDGYVFRTLGDEFEIAFATAEQGLATALSSQRALQMEKWGETGPLKVRMGLHTGPATPRGDDYDGYLTLAHTKRLMSVAYGQQVLMSEITEALVRDQLPTGVTLRDLGAHRLKDFDRAEHIYQVSASDLSSDFPPLASLDIHPNNLPVQLTSFVGREKELKELKELLRTTRLLTLTGPGGTGKTRLSLELATQELEEYKDGAWLVELAPLADPSLIAQKVATTLGVREQPGRAVLDSLLDYIRAKNLLLILDNCEHLIDATAKLVEKLLQTAPGLKIVASSREGLGIVGEKIFRVPSLDVPEEGKAKDLVALAKNDCVRLFVERASAVYPRFHLSERNARAIIEICERLDGIPLALELAAARAKMFTPDQIAARLDDRFRLLTGGSRTALERHQTLFALIEWSHNLLSEPERVLLRRLSVFAGGWTFEAAQEVCGGGLDEEMLDLLSRLVDKSLVEVEEEGERRYRMLETIRQYARDRLFESGESPTVRDMHLTFFVRLAEEAEPKLRSAEQLTWLNRLDAERDNLRAALEWATEQGEGENAMRLAGALAGFWETRGHYAEGAKWCEIALRVAETDSKAALPLRAKVLHGTARLKLFDLKSSYQLAEESLRLWTQLDDKWWMAVACETVGFISLLSGEVAEPQSYFEQGVALARQVEDGWPLALNLERLAWRVADPTTMLQMREEAVAIARASGDRGLLSQTLMSLGASYSGAGDLQTAERIQQEALVMAREIGDGTRVLLSMAQLINISCLKGETKRAKTLAYQFLAEARKSEVPLWLGMVSAEFALVASTMGRYWEALRLVSAVESITQSWGMLGAGGERVSFVKVFLKELDGILKAKLPPTEYEVELDAGRGMSVEQAIALATETVGEEE